MPVSFISAGWPPLPAIAQQTTNLTARRGRETSEPTAASARGESFSACRWLFASFGVRGAPNHCVIQPAINYGADALDKGGQDRYDDLLIFICCRITGRDLPQAPARALILHAREMPCCSTLAASPAPAARLVGHHLSFAEDLAQKVCDPHLPC